MSALPQDALTRIEQDFLGRLAVPAEAYWGVHTARAIENFPITHTVIGDIPELVIAFGHVKKATALANLQLQVLEPHVANAIVAACDDLIAGRLHEQFVVDVVQGGAGTSTNMNANEVVANRALEHLGLPKGRYDVIHPNDHVNASQSTNDAYPTALRLALWAMSGDLLYQMEHLRTAFSDKAEEFSRVLKIGRTQLQDAVPMTLGQEFAAYATMIGEDLERLREACELLTEVNLGATAIGTGINAPPGYADLVVPILSESFGLPLSRASDLVAATQDTGAFLHLSGVLKRAACKLSKVCNDLRLLSSGPQAGFGDIRLPPRQAGSSIMPGKVNPVIPEVMNQVAFEVIGNDMTITMAGEAGQLQLNAFEPIILWSLTKSIRHLARACRSLRVNCVEGIEPDLDVLARRVAESVTLVTVLNPVVGYEKASLIAKTALATGSTIAQAAQQLEIRTAREIEALLVPENLTSPHAHRAP